MAIPAANADVDSGGVWHHWKCKRGGLDPRPDPLPTFAFPAFARRPFRTKVGVWTTFLPDPHVCIYGSRIQTP